MKHGSTITLLTQRNGRNSTLKRTKLLQRMQESFIGREVNGDSVKDSDFIMFIGYLEKGNGKWEMGILPIITWPVEDRYGKNDCFWQEKKCFSVSYFGGLRGQNAWASIRIDWPPDLYSPLVAQSDCFLLLQVKVAFERHTRYYNPPASVLDQCLERYRTTVGSGNHVLSNWAWKSSTHISYLGKPKCRGSAPLMEATAVRELRLISPPAQTTYK